MTAATVPPVEMAPTCRCSGDTEIGHVHTRGDGIRDETPHDTHTEES